MGELCDVSKRRLMEEAQKFTIYAKFNIHTGYSDFVGFRSAFYIFLQSDI